MDTKTRTRILIMGASLTALHCRDVLSEHHDVVIVGEDDEECDGRIIVDDGPDIKKLLVGMHEPKFDEYSLGDKKPSKSKNKKARRESRGWV